MEERNSSKEAKDSEGEALLSPRPAPEQCPHCHKFVPDVYRHTSLDDCEVINQQVADVIDGKLSF